jgi:hypothetical protein
MKTKVITTITALILFTGITRSQVNLPDVDLFTLAGTKISAEKIKKDSTVTILVFWSTNNYKCREEILELNDLYIEELKDKDIKIIAVCTGNMSESGAVNTFVSGHDIAFDVYIDKNNSLKRAMNISAVPFTMVIDDRYDSYNSYLGCTLSLDDILSNGIKNYLALNQK